MKSPSKLRWGAAFAVWAASFLLLHETHRRVDEVTLCQEDNDRLRGDARFCRLEAERLARVSQLRDGLVLHVNSVTLGLIGLRGDLVNLASAAGVRLDLFETDVTQPSEDQIVCHLIARGPVKGLLNLLDEVDRRPFLQPRSMELIVPASGSDAVLDERLNLHYQVRVAVADREDPLGNSPPATGAQTR